MKARGARHEALPAEAAGLPVRKVKLTVSWSWLSVHGAAAQGFFAVAGTPGSGTLTPNCAIANTCDALFGSIATAGFPLIMRLEPTTPCASEMNGLRRPEAPS